MTEVDLRKSSWTFVASQDSYLWHAIFFFTRTRKSQHLGFAILAVTLKNEHIEPFTNGKCLSENL